MGNLAGGSCRTYACFKGCPADGEGRQTGAALAPPDHCEDTPHAYAIAQPAASSGTELSSPPIAAEMVGLPAGARP